MGIRSFAADLLPSALQSRARPVLPAVPAPLPNVTTYGGLAAKLGYLSKADQRQVHEAYRFADEAHLGQTRASGEPYITHPLAVAGIVADWRLDAHALMAALLHDVIEDCGADKNTLIERFGAPTADLVDGLTKLDKLRFSTREEGQAESFRKMLLAMSRDVRVILIKLADRLHNMRTLGAVAPHKRIRVASETLEIYAPIAHRLGLNLIYRELQELAFAGAHPWRHATIDKALAAARGHRRDIVARVYTEVQAAFQEAKLKVVLAGREKTVYSIYSKMREKHAGFADVNDLFGIRIIVSTLPECYLALGALHQLYKPIPGRFKDYIAIPKPNGYKSLHTTVISPVGTPVEMQIRTEEMHAVAETGVAAHWLYKAGKNASSSHVAQRLGSLWLKSLMDIQHETRDAAEFLEHVKIDLEPDAVYVFTPKSKIMALPRGATPVDFAYAIHSDVGNHTVAARVNGEPAALDAELHSGDVVEVLTDPAGRPTPAWLNMVRTGRARSKIRNFLKTLATDDSYALGLRLLIQAMRAEGLTLPPLPGSPEAPDTPGTLWPELLRWSGNQSIDELLVDLGVGRKIAPIVAKRAAAILAGGDAADLATTPDAVTLSISHFRELAEREAAAQALVIDGSEGASVRMAPCCHPIPGDAILGYMGRGEGLAVHTKECRTGQRLFERDPERWVTLEWAPQPVRLFDAMIQVLVRNRKGMLAQMAMAVAKAQVDITHIAMNDSAGGEAADLRLTISVRDRQHLAEVLRALKRTPNVLRVQRLRG
ncbi:MAG: bifunctional (p)ppGpp synthetase/guanosine-3',5'-bis(diphosphate) 3'-pyrophosphohydrolase [Proteobacteria bacterium]|nr:bifunctional (p)ppGpp synthetase/guanosine-3',5'-bis(diphosphate) 3'-pyrophosphohydrolase [Pseudomonadota bacterium]